MERERYRLEPFIPEFAQFEQWHVRRVLEVGIRLGTDFVRFVRAGALATGVYLINAAVDDVRRVLALGGEARIMLYPRRSWFAYGVWVRHALLALRPWRSITDVLATHLQSRGAKAFTDGEVRELFSECASAEMTRYLALYDRRVAGPLTSLLGLRLGWFVAIRARR